MEQLNHIGQQVQVQEKIETMQKVVLGVGLVCAFFTLVNFGIVFGVGVKNLADKLTEQDLNWATVSINTDTRIIVDASGQGDYLTITEALNHVQPGDSIFVRPGTYNEGIYYQGAWLMYITVPNITISGSESPKPVLIVDDIIIKNSDTAVIPLKNVIIKNFEIIGSVTVLNALNPIGFIEDITIEKCKFLYNAMVQIPIKLTGTIKRVNINGNELYDPNANNFMAIKLFTPPNYNEISDVIISDNIIGRASTGVQIQGNINNIKLIRNIFENSVECIRPQGVGNYHPRNIQIIDNTFNCTWDNYDITNLLLENNTINNIEPYLFFGSHDPVTIINNNFITADRTWYDPVINFDNITINGNYWAQYTDCQDLNLDNICDSPYVLRDQNGTPRLRDLSPLVNYNGWSTSTATSTALNNN